MARKRHKAEDISSNLPHRCVNKLCARPDERSGTLLAFNYSRTG